MEFEILEELRRIGRPFETNIYDIESFKERCQNGYKVKSEVGDHGSESLPPVELKEDMHTLNLQQLLNCVYYLFYTDEERCLPYVDRSYELCTTTEQNDRFNVGEMWYYHAWFYDVEEYLNAAAEFIKAERYWNAAGAHWSHLNMSGWDDYRDFVECVVEAVNRGQAGNPLEYADNYCAWYSDDTSWDEENLIDTDESMLVRMLEPICEVATDELFLNTLLILNTIERDHREDVENLLALYPDCPKLLLLHQYYGAEELSRLYGLWIEHSDWFETEDRINLAWLYYDRGEYQMVRMITENAAEEVLIRAEAYMQNPEEADLVQLYNDISKTLGENISEVLYARLTVIRNLIGNKLGLPTDKGRMADACFSIFDADSSLGQFIIASLRNENGEYSVANKICDEVLNRITNTDPLYYRVLLLKSDVLMNLAGETDGDQQTQYYTDAIAILEGLRDSMETNYMMCLERLAEAYKAVGRDSDMQATIDVLNTLR